MSEELVFASTDKALQHLSDITGKRVKIALPAEPENEVFKFGSMAIDVGSILKALKSKKLKPNKTINNFPVTQYAEQFLALKKEQGYKQKHRSLFISVDMNYVKNISDSRLKEPGIAIETNQGVMLIDGNHRLAKLYLEGEEEMKVHVLAKEQAEPFLLSGEIL